MQSAKSLLSLNFSLNHWFSKCGPGSTASHHLRICYLSLHYHLELFYVNLFRNKKQYRKKIIESSREVSDYLSKEHHVIVICELYTISTPNGVMNQGQYPNYLLLVYRKTSTEIENKGLATHSKLTVILSLINTIIIFNEA